MIGPIRRRAAAAGLLLSLSACSTLLDPRADGGDPQQQWRGRFSLAVEPTADAPDGQRQTGSFALSRGNGYTELELLSPLGNTLASARETPAGATLRTADGRRYDAPDADALTERLFGWRIPVRKLPGWLQGRIADVTEAGPTPSQPVEGEDDGWRVRFDQWRESAPMTPSRLLIRYPGRVTLRLVVDTPAQALSVTSPDNEGAASRNEAARRTDPAATSR